MKAGDHTQDEFLELDAEFRQEMEEAGKLYLKRLEEADEFMRSITAKDFVRALRDGDDPIERTHAYEKLAGQEMELSNNLSAVRLAMRLMKRHKLWQ